MQRARGVVDLVVARGVNPEVPHIPLINLPQQQQQPPTQFLGVDVFAQQQQKQSQQLSPDRNSSTRSRSSQSSQQSAAASSRSASPAQPAATTTTTAPPPPISSGVDVVEVITSASLAPPSLGRSPSALSDGSKTGSDMVVCILLSSSSSSSSLFLSSSSSSSPPLEQIHGKRTSSSFVRLSSTTMNVLQHRSLLKRLTRSGARPPQEKRWREMKRT